MLKINWDETESQLLIEIDFEIHDRYYFQENKYYLTNNID